MHDKIKMKAPTVSICNSTSLLKNSVVNVPSNGVTSNLKKRAKEKRIRKLPICKLGVGFFDASTCKAKLG